MRTLFVTNLTYSINEDDLRKVFEEYGEVASVKLITNKGTDKSRGIAFVTMLDGNEADQAKSDLDGAEYEGRRIYVNDARTPE